MILLPFVLFIWTGTTDKVHFCTVPAPVCPSVLTDTCMFFSVVYLASFVSFALMCKALGCCLLQMLHWRRIKQSLLMCPAFAKHPKQTPFCIRNSIFSLCGFELNWEHDMSSRLPLQKRQALFGTVFRFALGLSCVIVSSDVHWIGFTSTCVAKLSLGRDFIGGLDLTLLELDSWISQKNGSETIVACFSIKDTRSAILTLVLRCCISQAFERHLSLNL